MPARAFATNAGEATSQEEGAGGGKVTTTICPGCGKEIEQKTKATVYCNLDCYRRYYRRTHKTPPRARLPKPAPPCRKGTLYRPKDWEPLIKPEIDALLTRINPNYRSQQYLTTSFCLDYIDEKYPTLLSYGIPERKRCIVIYLQELGWYNRNKGSKAAVMTNPNADTTKGGVIYA